MTNVQAIQLQQWEDMDLIQENMWGFLHILLTLANECESV
jgi:hypothetical protein